MQTDTKQQSCDDDQTGPAEHDNATLTNESGAEAPAPSLEEMADAALIAKLEHEAMRLRDELHTDENAAREAVAEAAMEYLEDAEVHQFVPLLAHRAARERLSSEEH